MTERKRKGMGLGIAAMAIYVVGGMGIFSGLGMIFFGGGRNFFGLGDLGSVGYLFLCVGLAFSMIGVMMMRVFRNRPFV